MTELPPRQHFNAIAPGSRMVDPTAYDPISPVPAFEQQYGTPFFEYLKQNPEDWELFNLKMEYDMRDLVPSASIPALDLPAEGLVADIGGGLGYLLEQAKLHQPGLKTVLCEQQFVCKQARQFREGIDAAYSTNIFTGILPRADVYLLSRIIHDCHDEQALAVLGNIRRSAPQHARLKVIDIFMDEDRRGPPRALQQQRSMELLLGSKQHTVMEVAALLKQSGWQAVDYPQALSPDMSCLTAEPA